MRKSHPAWYSVGFFVVPFMVLALGYLNIHPELYRQIPARFGTDRDASFAGIGWDEEEAKDPPLEYVSDSFKGLFLTTEQPIVTSFWSLWNRPASEVVYEWRYKVKNLTDNELRISVSYELLGDGGYVIARSDGYEVAEAGETVEIVQQEKIDYLDARLVRDRSWSIGHRPTR
ncbi:hypothetical protein [Ruegeria arenilitoris]|uniref:hypothetical protein n=1 Tax=Ruegeria arenilitoris TaxID=1173585 RepID=UPI00147A5D33|nr:hypothetical protein [Ruegeria arenilitoris]